MIADRRRAFVTGVLAGAVAALAIFALVLVITGERVTSGPDRADQARDLIEHNYYKPVGTSTLDKGSIEGMIRALHRRYGDRFSHYLGPKALRRLESDTRGQFSGVGLTVRKVPRGLRVSAVIPHTPAQRAKIEQGDVITAVDGRSIAGLPIEVSTSRIKGPPGTKVNVRVVSATTGQTRNVTLKRADVRIPAASGQLRQVDGKRVAYVRFSTFSAGSHGELSSTVERLYHRGAQGLVLDLRGNGGGLLNEAVLAASIFIQNGLIVSTDSRTMGNHDYNAVGDALNRRPMVVLIDHNTASAAEILASALADHHLATLVGTRSFGKGTVQEDFPLPGGGALHLTVAQYLTANGVSIAGKGIPPDVRARDNPHTKVDEGLQRGLTVLGRMLAPSR